MILEAIMSLCTGIIQLLFSWINLPQFPEGAKTAINTYMSLIFDNLDFLNFFINVNTLKTVALIAVAVYGFEHVYKIMIWVIHKIPLSIT